MESQSVDEMPVVITMSEFMRRMKDMAETGGGGGFNMMGGMPDSYNVSVNANHAVVAKVLAAKTEATQVKIAKQAFDLGMLSQNMLSGKDLTDFIERSVEIMAGKAKK